MKSSQKGALPVVVMFIIAALAVGGSIYTYVKLQKGQSSADQLLLDAEEALRRDQSSDPDKLTKDLLRARAVFLTENRKLQEMKSLLTQMYSSPTAVRDWYSASANLTPANSGLTQAEIDNYRQIVADAITASQNIPGILGTPVTQVVVDIQQEVVNQVQTQVTQIENQLSQVATTTATSTSQQNTQVNNPPPPSSSGNNSGRPRLVEGANSIN